MYRENRDDLPDPGLGEAVVTIKRTALRRTRIFEVRTESETRYETDGNNLMVVRLASTGSGWWQLMIRQDAVVAWSVALWGSRTAAEEQARRHARERGYAVRVR
jgi:hypothetical protein